MLQTKKVLPVLAAFAIGLAIWMGCQTANTAPAQPSIPVTAVPVTGLQPGPNDARIAYWTARLLEEFHYQQRPLDPELSARLFDGYINTLDPRHENFLQSDVAEFAPLFTNLTLITVADLRPVFQVYERYLKRYQQHNAYTDKLLVNSKFKFNADEKIQTDRRHAPFPKNLTEAEQLWRQRLRYDYLQEKLASEIFETNGVFTVKLPADAHTNIIAKLARHARWSSRMMTNLDSDTVLTVYLNALAHAYDPHSDYFSAPKAQDFSIGMNLSLFGIGAQLMEDDGYCTIRELVHGGPAETSKQLKQNDRIVGVAQTNQPPVDVVDMELEKVVQQIRGPKGTEVRLTISPAEDRTARKVVTLVRDEIKLENSEAKAKLIERPDGHGGTNRIGVIDLPSFYAPVSGLGNLGSTPKFTSVDVAKLVEKLKQEKVDGIIIDLRFNPGGSLEEAKRFTGLFIKEGPVVLARNSDGQTMVESDPDPSVLYEGPLVVMINHFSASASEIAAAALQDYGRALIVGDKSTHGKGTVQNLTPLKPFVKPANKTATNDPGTLKITIRKFYRVSGASTQLKGVEPDIVLPSIFDYSKQIGESAQDNPLPWDTIQPVPYDKLNLVQPYLTNLLSSSAARLVTNQEFNYVRQDIQLMQKAQDEKTATLNEREAIKDREERTLRDKSRESERANRPRPNLKIYELTVKNSSEDGLPAPEPYYETNSVANKATGFATVTNADFTTVFTNQNLGANSSATTNVVAKPVVSKSFQPDPVLDETEQILEDYIYLLSKHGEVSANK